MNKKFLYRKAYPIGILNDEDDYDGDRLLFWTDNSQEILSKKLRECTLDELIIELIDIFRDGDTNYSTLACLLGFQNCENNKQEQYIKKSFYQTRRSDLVKFQMDIEESGNNPLILRNLYLYFTNLPSIEGIKNKINEVYSDVIYEEREGIIICEKECNIIITKRNWRELLYPQ